MGGRTKGVSGQEILPSRVRGCDIVLVAGPSRQACVDERRIREERFRKVVESHPGLVHRGCAQDETSREVEGKMGQEAEGVILSN